MLNLFQHLDPENRCALKRKNPLIADENHVVRQRATAKKTGSSFRRYASRFLVLRLRFRHAELVSASRPKNRCALKNMNPLNALKHGSPLAVQDHERTFDKIKTEIPKQVRDESE